MISQETKLGTICVENAVYTTLAGHAASSCFGVKGMAVRSVTDGLVHLLRRESMGKGVRVQFHEDNSISIDLHIMIDKDVNINAISSSIISEVKYNVTKATGTQVREVHVFVDSINPE